MARTSVFSYNGENDFDNSGGEIPIDEYYGWTPGFQQPDPPGAFDEGDQTTGQGLSKGAMQGFDPAAYTSALFGQPSPTATGGGGGSSSSAPGGYAAPAPSPSSTTQGPNLMADFSSALSKLINGPSPKQAGMDVMTSAPVTAFNANAKRNEARDRQFLAERAAAGGYSGSGGFDSGVLSLRARTNEGMDRFAGEQANIQEQGRRDELMRALAMALQFGDAELARSLQRELGMGSLDVQRLGINTNRDTAMDQLGYNYANLENNVNQQLMDWFK
jgi:hypothetical protein